MDKQIYLPIMTGLLFGAFGALVFSPSAYSVWGFALATLAWGLAMGMTRQPVNHDYEEFMKKHEQNFKDLLRENSKQYESQVHHMNEITELKKQLDSVRTAINMKQLGR